MAFLLSVRRHLPLSLCFLASHKTGFSHSLPLPSLSRPLSHKLSLSATTHYSLGSSRIYYSRLTDDKFGVEKEKEKVKENENENAVEKTSSEGVREEGEKEAATSQREKEGSEEESERTEEKERVQEERDVNSRLFSILNSNSHFQRSSLDQTLQSPHRKQIPEGKKMEDAFSSFFSSKKEGEKEGEKEEKSIGKDDSLTNFFNSISSYESPIRQPSRSRPPPPSRSSSLTSSSSSSSSSSSFHSLSRKEKIAIQKEFEKEVVTQSKLEYQNIVKKMMHMGRVASLKPCQKLMVQWYLPLLGAVKREIDGIERTISYNGTPPPYAAVFLILDPEKIAILTLHSIIGQVIAGKPEGVPIHSVLIRLAELLEAEVNMERIEKKNTNLSDYLSKRSKSIQKLLHKSNMILEKEKVKRDYQSIKAAAVLTDMLLGVAELRFDEKGEVKFSLPSIPKGGRGKRKAEKYYFWGLELLCQSSADMSEILQELVKKQKENVERVEEEEEEEHEDEEEEGNELDGEEKETEENPETETELSTKKTEEKKTKHEKVLSIGKIYSRKKTINVLKLNEKVFNYADQSFQALESSLARHVPMVVEPKPWSTPTDGGYLLYPAHLVRPVGSEIQKAAVWDAHRNLGDLYECVSILGKTPWKINKEILKVVEEHWSRGGGLADIPSREDLPTPEESLKLEKGELAYFRALGKVKQLNYDRHGLRCTLQYKLEIANKFKEFDCFYFPHNLDFRGRAYPVPPHFNHLGADLDRGLLLFANERPIGQRGLFWMKVHLANLFGYNKVSFLHRVAWTENHLPMAMESAERPLDGNMWWCEADDPWQALATCFELKAVLALPPDQRPLYRSSLPIHMDGSCNGLQHYAALGGDIEGGGQVNLIPAPAPGDVYSAVAKKVAIRVEEDAKQGNEIAQLLNGKVERKIVKQTIMTSVYGVTFVGARQQIQNALEDRCKLDDEMYWPCSAYLAKLTFESLKELFSGARGIMDWLAECASIIGNSGEPVRWTTPLNLPVVQPYRQSKRAEIRTALQVVKLMQSGDTFPVNSRKQCSAFPPNFVHSLDSTHMMFTARAMYKAGLEFSAVHDSYWTHACDVDRMNIILRKCFIQLHKEPLLENLLAEFRTRNPLLEFPPVPPRGELDLDVIQKSPYFFH